MSNDIRDVCTLRIDLLTPNVLTGQDVSGSVILSVNVETPASNLALYLTCKEYTEWPSTDKSGEKCTVKHKGKHRLLSQRYLICAFPTGHLETGQFSFPFSIRTPKSVPSSFSYVKSRSEKVRTYAEIRYSLVAKIEESKIKNVKIPLHFTQALDDPIVPFKDEKTARLSTWCCCYRGVVKLYTTFNKTAFAPGETASVNIYIDNQDSELQGRGLKLTLYRVIHIRDEFNHDQIIKEIVNSIQVEDPTPSGDSLLAVCQKTIDLLIPSDAQVDTATSVKGKLIECMYTLAAEVIMQGSWMCYGEVPRVEKTMVIYPPEALVETPNTAEELNLLQVTSVIRFVSGAEYNYMPLPKTLKVSTLK